MQPHEPMPAGELLPHRGTAQSFRLLAARLRRTAQPEPAPVPARQAAAPRPVPALLAIAPPAAAAPETGEAATALLDIMWGATDLSPQERAMAGDTLLLLLPRLSAADVAMLAERIAAMDRPPPLLVSRLLGDPRLEVGGVVLERAQNLAPEDLVEAGRDADSDRLRLLARRRSVPRAVAARLVQAGDLLSLLALLRNPDAELSFESFFHLSQMAGQHPALQAPLALRADLPLAVALDLLWRLPPELRRVIMSRFLSDSAALSRLLAIALAAGAGGAAGIPAQADVDAALEPFFAGRPGDAAVPLSTLTGVAAETAGRILADEEGEALVVLLKALGLGRAHCDGVLDRLRQSGGPLRQDRPPEELKAVFDSLSSTKARVLLVYWDWFVRKAGPYAAVSGPGLVEAAPLA
ncbi:DUF2336 domain-containing protein [Aestuariivirga sp.]|uniref:DUF2336 domain-containing protein n=1 Tax=Aestuariivirga sp. TaxID=2650926 RepID=UPI0025C4C1F7|nr:DUF2336 domain-containing protein [Aestuariivirga sp.]MCA3555279.1 DUF2336 domain-containing protein [Aestuariivirga sp.]